MTHDIKIFSPASLNQNIPALDDLCAHWDFWDKPQMLETLAHPNYMLCYVGDSKHWHAVLLSLMAVDGADVVFIYVDESMRGKGLALLLLEFLEQHLAANGLLGSIILEVRVSNSPAIYLYKKFGMKKIGLRKKYYQNGDDALVFSKAISK